MQIRWSETEQQFLMDIVLGRKAPTLIVTGAQILNVYTGQLEKKDLAIAGRRIAYVGELENSGIQTNSSTVHLDVTGHVIVPGYIEPHTHPFQLYHPFSLAEKVATLGTTTLINDNLVLFTQLEDAELYPLLHELDQSPIKHFWWARFDSQTRLPRNKKNLFQTERVKKFLSYPLILQGGELTDWMALFQENQEMSDWMIEAKKQGKRVEGHAPGASYRTLARLAVAGVTGDHESISVEEVWHRLELGYMVTLRHSSIRPDLPVLLKGLLQKESIPWHRMMMTTDGATPLYFKKGFTDYIIRTALEVGCNPVHAYQMVTINPACYYHLESDIGGLAPGRLADFNVLSSIYEPTPVMVIAEGKVIAEEGRLTTSFPSVKWDKYKGFQWNISEKIEVEDFVFPFASSEPIPVMNLINPVITKATYETLKLENGQVVWDEEDDRIGLFLIDRTGERISPAILRGFGRGIDGIASSYTGSNDLLVIGKNSQAMAKAANHVIDRRGGISWFQGDSLVYHLPLPIAGTMSFESIDSLILQLEPFIELLQTYGYPFSDPIYAFLFLTSTHLPQVRITVDGLLSIKDKKILYPSVPREKMGRI